MKNYLQILSVWIFLHFALINEAATQDFNYYSFNEVYDFELNEIYSMVQDSSGLIWLGCSDGLVRFDGQKFKTFYHPNYGRAASNILIDQKGKVWYSNFGGQIFYIKNDSVHVALSASADNAFVIEYGIYGDSLLVYTTDNDKHIHQLNLLTKEESIIFSAKSSLFALFKPDSILIQETYKIPSSKDDGVLEDWVIDMKQDQQFCFKDKTPFKFRSGVLGLIPYKGETLFFESVVDEIKFHFLLKTATTFTVKDDRLSAFKFNSIRELDEQLVFLTKQGLVFFDMDAKTVDPKTYLPTASCSDLLKDREGNLWISTLNQGIYIVPNFSFKHAKIEENEIKAAIYDGHEQLFILNNEGELYSLKPPYSQKKMLGSGFETTSELSCNGASGLLILNNASQAYNIQKESFYTLPSRQIQFKDAVILGDSLMLVTESYFSAVYLLDGKLRPDYTVFPQAHHRKPALLFQDFRRLRSNQVEMEGGSDHFYINYIDGLYYFGDKDSPQVVLYHNAPIQVRKILEDPKKGLWASTINESVLYIQQGKVLEEFKFPRAVDKMVFTDSLLFVASADVLYRLDLRTKEIDQIDEADGLIRDPLVYLFARKDTLYYIGDQFIQSIPTDYHDVNEIPPILNITEVHLFGESIPLSRQYDFTYNESNLSFSFNTSSIRSQGNAKVQYRLIGSKEGWIELNSKERVVRFPKLGSGKYTFQLKACNEDGFCSKVEEIDFKIGQPFYFKWWFILLNLILIGGVIFVIYRSQLMRIQAAAKLRETQESYQKEILQSKITAIRSQMNPHFMFNALNTIQNFIVSNQKDIASHYLADFADLIRKYLDQSRQDSISLREEIDTLEIYLNLEKLRFEENLNFEMDVDERLELDQIEIPTMLLQPYVENAIKHGLLHRESDRLLQLRFFKKNDLLICEIEDNGIGRTKSMEINRNRPGHKSFATSAMAERIRLYNQGREAKITVETFDIDDSVGKASGTKVLVSIPLSV